MKFAYLLITCLAFVASLPSVGGDSSSISNLRRNLLKRAVLVKRDPKKDKGPKEQKAKSPKEDKKGKKDKEPAPAPAPPPPVVVVNRPSPPPPVANRPAPVINNPPPVRPRPVIPPPVVVAPEPVIENPTPPAPAPTNWARDGVITDEPVNPAGGSGSTQRPSNRPSNPNQTRPVNSQSQNAGSSIENPEKDSNSNSPESVSTGPSVPVIVAICLSIIAILAAISIYFLYFYRKKIHQETSRSMYETAKNENMFYPLHTPSLVDSARLSDAPAPINFPVSPAMSYASSDNDQTPARFSLMSIGSFESASGFFRKNQARISGVKNDSLRNSVLKKSALKQSSESPGMKERPASNFWLGQDVSLSVGASPAVSEA